MQAPDIFSPTEMADRLACIRTRMSALGLDALISSDAANVRYTTGFRGEPRTLLITEREVILYTSFRTLPWAEKQTRALGAKIQLCTTAPALDDIAQRLGGQCLRIGIDHSSSHQGFLGLTEQFHEHRLVPSCPIEQVRRTKSPAEIELLKKSQRINESIFNAVLPKIRPGMSEREVQGLILTEMAIREEVDQFSFTPIVAVGPNAWEIHHLPDHTVIEQNDMLLLDLGIVYQGYASDMTRTICVGKASDQMHEIYQTVGRAQAAAIAAMLPGAQTHDIDQAARNIITDAGHGRSFTHGLGHSIGLETHDPGLNLSPFTPNETLAAGMAFTVEPGIYLENGFGVRTEDIVVVTDDGNINITSQTHNLIELNT